MTGAKDTTSLFVFNTSDGSAGAAPLAVMPIPAMYLGLAISPALAALYNAGGPGLVALVDDDGNTAAALWLLTLNGSNWASAAWLPLFQYAPRTLESAGNDLLELSDAAGGAPEARRALRPLLDVLDLAVRRAAAQ